VRRPVPLIYAAVFAQTISFVAIVPLLPDYKDRFALSNIEAGGVFWAAGVVLLLLAVPCGTAIDRCGPRVVTIAGLGVVALSDVGQALADDYPSLMAARVGAGLGTLAIWAGAQTWVAASVSERRRSAALAAMMPIAGAGAAVAPFAAGVLADEFGRGAPFWVCGVLTLAVVLGLLLAERGGDARPKPIPLLTTLRAVRGERLVLAGVALLLVSGSAENVVNILAPGQLDDEGLSETAIGAILSAASASFLAGSLAVARLSGRCVNLRFGGIGALVVAGTLVPLAISNSAAAVAAGVILRYGALALTYTIAFPLAAAGIARRGLLPGAVNGLMMLAWGVTNTAGPLGGGALADAVGARWTYVGLICGAVVLALWLVPSRERAAAPSYSSP
jgi:predicted MFS family arabinose efflux permease